MRVIGAAAVACAPMLLGIGSACACGEQLSGAMRHVQSAKYEIVFTSLPAPIETGRHFSLDLAICPRGSALLPDAVRVDAVMPEHRHGMNYRPEIQSLGGGRWRVEGLMFHMAGRWEMVFEVAAGAITTRLTDDVVLR